MSLNITADEHSLRMFDIVNDKMLSVDISRLLNDVRFLSGVVCILRMKGVFIKLYALVKTPCEKLDLMLEAFFTSHP